MISRPGLRGLLLAFYLGGLTSSSTSGVVVFAYFNDGNAVHDSDNAAGAGGASGDLAIRPNGGAGGAGGGLFDNGAATLRNVTLAGNRASAGGSGADSSGAARAGNGGAAGGGGAIEFRNPGSMSLTR